MAAVREASVGADERRGALLALCVVMPLSSIFLGLCFPTSPSIPWLVADAAVNGNGVEVDDDVAWCQGGARREVRRVVRVGWCGRKRRVA